MLDNFLCECGHRNKFHVSLEDAKKYREHIGRMCIEYKDAICVKDVWYHNKEEICKCNDFIADNLKTLEMCANDTNS